MMKEIHRNPDLDFIIENQRRIHLPIRLETKSCRILPLTYATKYDMT